MTCKNVNKLLLKRQRKLFENLIAFLTIKTKEQKFSYIILTGKKDFSLHLEL